MSVSGDASNQKMKSMNLSYLTNPVSEITEYATLTFYNVYVSDQKSEDNAINCLEKQAHLIMSYNDIDETMNFLFLCLTAR